jgi:hypothetical protein
MRVATRLAVAVAVLVGMAGAANATTVMKQCGDQWQAAKANGVANGQTWPQFLKQCRAQLASTEGASAPSQASFAPAAPAAPTQSAPTGYANTTAQCDADYAANKAAIRASGQTKREFVAACRAGNEVIPQGAASAPAPAQPGSLFPWQQPASPAPASAPTPATYAPAPAPANYGSAAAPTGAGEFASEQEARYRCPSGTVVWVNTKSRVYHFAGTENYGHTKRGAYMCEADAQAAGARAAMNERHP